MTRETDDRLWRDFPETAGEFETRIATEEDCRAYWIEGALGQHAHVRALQLDAAVERARRLPVRVRGLRPHSGGRGYWRKDAWIKIPS